MEQYELDGPHCIRVDAPNTNQRGEYFAGYLRELESACKDDYSTD